jgi:hypothetical protein
MEQDRLLVLSFDKILFCPECGREMRKPTFERLAQWRVCLAHGRFVIFNGKIVYDPR